MVQLLRYSLGLIAEILVLTALSFVTSQLPDYCPSMIIYISANAPKLYILVDILAT